RRPGTCERHVPALCARVRGIPRRSAVAARILARRFVTALRPIAGAPLRPQADLFPAAALLLLPRAAPDPVLRSRPLPVAGPRGSGGRRNPRRARAGPRG